MAYIRIWLYLFLFVWLACDHHPQANQAQYDIIVIGGGTGAATAAISAGRQEVSTLLINPVEWLGGMLSSAGVSAIDGNHEMPAGLWGELRTQLRIHYGGAAALATGWVSHTQFEPSIADSILKSMTLPLEQLKIAYNSQWQSIQYDQDVWVVGYTDAAGKEHTVKSKILIDGTDLGDVAAAAGVPFRLGMDSRTDTGEAIAPTDSNDIIQDLTYTAILKDYGDSTDMTIPKPRAYDPKEFECACLDYCAGDPSDVHPCATMLTYAKLPNDKYLINWPRQGNDYYVNDVLLSREQRAQAYQEAKDKTLRFIYFIQHELGYKHLAIADDEYQTPDRLPLMPYHREGRRIKGKVLMTLEHISDPYHSTLYRTGVAVGDYPIDHHHLEVPEAPEIDFPMVPSFNIPLGSLLPLEHKNLIIADKAMSVSNIVNGSSRLQPVIMQVGQVAGIIAAHAIQNQTSTDEVPVRDIQQTILDDGGYLMPYWDVKPDHPYFASIQRIGACGILKGIGEPYKWANRTWFYPDIPVDRDELVAGLAPYLPDGYSFPEGSISKEWISSVLSLADDDPLWQGYNEGAHTSTALLSRAMVAHIIDQHLKPFARSIDIEGLEMR